MDNHLKSLPSIASGDKREVADIESEIAAQYPRLSQSDQRFLDQLLDLPPLGTLPVEEERARMREGQTATLAEFAVEAQEYHTSACTVHLIKPLKAQSPMPITIYLHGGGWVLGDLQTHTKLVCELAVRSQSVVAFIDYPRAPEHRFPVPLEACVTALIELLQSAESLGLDRNRFALIGDSSGGNLVAALILSVIERNLPLPTRQVLLYPATDYNWATPSYSEFQKNPNLSQFTMKWFWDNYLPEASASSDPLVSPLRAQEEVFCGFPPTLIITCEYDILRDEGEQFAARLIRAGVEVTAVRWLGSLHGFLVTESLAAAPSAQTCIDVIAGYLKKGYGIEP
jgi:acetyl esterase